MTPYIPCNDLSPKNIYREPASLTYGRCVERFLYQGIDKQTLTCYKHFCIGCGHDQWTYLFNGLDENGNETGVFETDAFGYYAMKDYILSLEISISEKTKYGEIIEWEAVKQQPIIAEWTTNATP